MSGSASNGDPLQGSMRDKGFGFSDPLIHDTLPHNDYYGRRVLMVLTFLIGFGSELLLSYMTSSSQIAEPLATHSESSLFSELRDVARQLDQVFPPSRPHDPGIAVVMWYSYSDEEAQIFADLNFAMNRAYCELHGYTMIVSKVDRQWGKKLINEENHPEVRAAWQRVPLVASYLDDFAYVMYIDADAFFYRDAMPLHVLIEQADKATMAGADLILSRDVDSAAAEVKPPAAKTREDEVESNINAGVFIARSSSRVRSLLSTWERLAETGPPIDDQQSLRTLWLENASGMRNWTYMMEFGDLQTFVPMHLARIPGMQPQLCKLSGCPNDLPTFLANHPNPLVCHLPHWGASGRVLVSKDYAPHWGLEGQSIIEGLQRIAAQTDTTTHAKPATNTESRGPV